MSERMTQDEIRRRNIERFGTANICADCDREWFSSDAEQHRPACPCDPANVVVSREDLADALNALDMWNNNHGNSTPECAQRLWSALYKEPTP